MLYTFLVILTLTVVYWFPVRRWFGRWGTTEEDLTRVMAGRCCHRQSDALSNARRHGRRPTGRHLAVARADGLSARRVVQL